MRPAALLSVLVGVIGGYAVARFASVEITLLAGLVWWLVTASLLAVLVPRTTTNVAIVTLFLTVWIGAPLVSAGVALGFRDRAAEAIEDVFEDFEDVGDPGSTDGFGDSGSNDAYNECLADPETTFEECEQFAD